jgi:hypothetical protein
MSAKLVALLLLLNALQVRDMLFSYQKRRDFAELMLQHRDAGGQMPLMGDQQATQELHYKLQQLRARRE